MPDTYRGWSISHERPPIPTTAFDWQATGPNYDAWGDSEGWHDNGQKVHAATREALIEEIDAFIEEHE